MPSSSQVTAWMERVWAEPCEDCENRGRERIRSLSLNHSMLSMGSGPEVTCTENSAPMRKFLFSKSTWQIHCLKQQEVPSFEIGTGWTITPWPTTWKFISFPTFTCNETFSPSLTSTFSRGVRMVGLEPLLCLDGSLVTGEPGVAPSALSETSSDS